MLKRILFAAAVTGLVAGAALPLQSTSAEATPSGCWKAAKAKFPGAGMFKARHEYRKECRAHYKAYKTAMKAAKKAA
jgi:hypothetical protein